MSGSRAAGRSRTFATPRSPSGVSSSGVYQATSRPTGGRRSGERIFIDYNQNARDRTIASAYSVRPKAGAPVSAPVTWDELAEVAPEDFTVATMPARFAEVGDRHATIDEAVHSLQPLLDMYENDAAEGWGDMPYPPDYPKMPGEPKRVQPSRDRDRPR